MSYAHSNNYIRKDLYQPEENEYDDLKCDDNNEYSELTSNYQPQVNSFSPNQNEIPVPIVNFNVPFPCLNPRPRFNSINVFGNNYMNMFNANGNYTTEKFGRKGWGVVYVIILTIVVGTSAISVVRRGVRRR